jgi:hypothetical protein
MPMDFSGDQSGNWCGQIQQFQYSQHVLTAFGGDPITHPLEMVSHE